MSGRKRGIMIALVLILVGLVVSGISLASVGFDISRLSTVAYVTNTYGVEASFRSITVIGDTEDLVLMPSQDGTCSIICREREDEPHRVEVTGDTLTIENTGRQKWHFFDFGFWTEGPSITVCLPEGIDIQALNVQMDTGDVKIPADFSFDSMEIKLSTGDVDCRASVTDLLSARTSTGRISLSGLTAGSIRLSTSTGGILGTGLQCQGDVEITVSTGRTTLENVACANLISSGSTGDIILKNVTATGAFNLRRSTGSVRFDACDAGEILVATGTGSVRGTLLTDKLFNARSNTGRVDVPGTASGGKCEVTTNTGSIQLEVQGASDGLH